MAPLPMPDLPTRLDSKKFIWIQ